MRVYFCTAKRQIKDLFFNMNLNCLLYCSCKVKLSVVQMSTCGVMKGGGDELTTVFCCHLASQCSTLIFYPISLPLLHSFTAVVLKPPDAELCNRAAHIGERGRLTTEIQKINAKKTTLSDSDTAVVTSPSTSFFGCVCRVMKSTGRAVYMPSHRD